MKGRTMYVIPVQHGAVGFAHFPYRHRNYRLPLRRGQHAHHDPHGQAVLDILGDDGEFVPCLHSVGTPLGAGRMTCLALRTPTEKNILSISRKTHHLVLRLRVRRKRVAGQEMLCACALPRSWPGRRLAGRAHAHSWHYSPQGKRTYFAAAFPSACGKTNLAMMSPTLPGWKVECVGDDIAWMNSAKTAGFMPSTRKPVSSALRRGRHGSNPNAMAAMREEYHFYQCGTDDDETYGGKESDDDAPGRIDRLERQCVDTRQRQECGASQCPFYGAGRQCPVIDPDWENPKGVPICAILVRRPPAGDRSPGASKPLTGTMACLWVPSAVPKPPPRPSARSAGPARSVCHAAFLRIPHGRLFQSLAQLRQKRTERSKLPKIFYVNWFRKTAGRQMALARLRRKQPRAEMDFRTDRRNGKAMETPIGYMPTEDAIDTHRPECERSGYEGTSGCQ